MLNFYYFEGQRSGHYGRFFNFKWDRSKVSIFQNDWWELITSSEFRNVAADVIACSSSGRKIQTRVIMIVGGT